MLWRNKSIYFIVEWFQKIQFYSDIHAQRNEQKKEYTFSYPFNLYKFHCFVWHAFDFPHQKKKQIKMRNKIEKKCTCELCCEHKIKWKNATNEYFGIWNMFSVYISMVQKHFRKRPHYPTKKDRNWWSFFSAGCS